LSALVQSSLDPILGLSPDGHINSWNRDAEKLLGYTAAEAEGKGLIDLLTLPGFEDDSRKVIREQMSVLAADPQYLWLLEAPIKRKDGSAVEVSVVLSGIFDSRKQFLGSSLMLRDVSDREPHRS
jgi:two-component system, sporulation sensor kinase E